MRLFILLMPFMFIGCSSMERAPNCVQSPDSPERKCEEQKIPKEKVFPGGSRERP